MTHDLDESDSDGDDSSDDNDDGISTCKSYEKCDEKLCLEQFLGPERFPGRQLFVAFLRNNI